MAAELAAWDDPTVDWSRFDVLVVRSAWNCVTRPDEFLAWAERAARVSHLHNPLEVLRWNMDKRYLADLAADDIAVVETQWIEPSDQWTPPPGEFVIKPRISGGGIDTARYGPHDHEHALAHRRRLQAGGRSVMVQPYVSSVDADGETALVFVGREYSHAVTKGALLRLGEGVVPELGEREVISPASPSESQILLAQAALESARRGCGRPPLYSRVDVLGGAADAPVVLELELVDPVLFLRFSPGSAERLASAIVQAIAS